MGHDPTTDAEVEGRSETDREGVDVIDLARELRTVAAMMTAPRRTLLTAAADALTQLLAAHDEARTELGITRGELKAADRHAMDLDKMIGAARADRDKAIADRLAMQKQRDGATLAAAKARQGFDAIAADLADAQAERDEAQRDAGKAFAERDEAREQAAKARQAAEIWSDGAKAVVRERDQAIAERDEAREMRDDITAALERVTRDRDQAIAKFEAIDDELLTAQQERNEARRERDALRTRLELTEAFANAPPLTDACNPFGHAQPCPQCPDRHEALAAERTRRTSAEEEAAAAVALARRYHEADSQTVRIAARIIRAILTLEEDDPC